METSKSDFVQYARQVLEINRKNTFLLKRVGTLTTKAVKAKEMELAVRHKYWELMDEIKSCKKKMFKWEKAYGQEKRVFWKMKTGRSLSAKEKVVADRLNTEMESRNKAEKDKEEECRQQERDKRIAAI